MRGLMIGAVSTSHPESPGPQLGAPAGGPGPYGGTVTEIVGVVPPRRDSPPVVVYYCRTYEKAVSGGGRGKKEDMC